VTEWWGQHVVDTGRSATVWLLLAFVTTYAVTRRVTVTNRRRSEVGAAGSGPVKDVHIGGVHVHHQVWGILLVLTVGVLELRFQPGTPWVEVLAVLFGVGAALALDEFALWLYLEDVYWTEEGRRSIDAVMIAAVTGVALLVGVSPVGVTDADVQTSGWLAASVFLLFHISYTIVCLLKGKLVVGLVGLPIPVLSLVGAVRMAHPESFWARRFYDEAKMGRARGRQRTLVRRRDRLRDLVSGGRT
jgi:hypothetical protein